MKKIVALSFALALTFSTTVCAAEPNLDRVETLAEDVEKSLPEYTSNAVSDMDGVRGIPASASANNMVTEGKKTKATCVVNKVDVTAVRYAQKKADAVGGTMLTVVDLSAPGVHLENAKVTINIEGIAAGDAVSVYKCVKGDWVAVTVNSVAENAVNIDFDYQGIYTFIK